MLFALWALGCSGAGPAPVGCEDLPAPGLVDGPRWYRVADTEGYRFLEVSYDDEVHLRVLDGEVAHEGPEGRTHAVALVGLTGGEHTLVVEATDANGCTTVSSVHRTSVTHLPGVVVDVLVDDEAMGADWTAVPITLRDTQQYGLVLLDMDQRIVWSSTALGVPRELQWTGEAFRGVAGGQLVELDLAGQLVAMVAPEDGPLHHDVAVAPDGTAFTLIDQTTAVDEYPLSSEALDTLVPAELRDQVVLHMDAEGRTLARRALSEVLDTRRVGYNSHDPSGEGLEWAHGNGLSLDGEGGVWVSARHQDALVHLDADLELVEILGDPAGWVAPWSEKLLTPVGALSWPYHTHAPERLEDGTLVVFDNHNFGGTPYDPPEGPTTSRAVGFRVADGTVEQLWERAETATGRLFSGAVGDVDVDEAGRVVADFGFVRFEEGRPLAELGRGEMAARVVSWDRDGRLILDVRVGTDPEAYPRGLFAYRVERVPALGGLRPMGKPAFAIEEASR